MAGNDVLVFTFEANKTHPVRVDKLLNNKLPEKGIWLKLFPCPFFATIFSEFCYDSCQVMTILVYSKLKLKLYGRHKIQSADCRL